MIAAFLPALVFPVHAQGIAPDDTRQSELVHMVRQDCGSCHGLTLQGGLGPALTPAALRGKPPEGLIATIVDGRPGTPMPSFRGLVDESEAAWVVERLVEGFPADGGPASTQQTAGTR
nr:cytochrome c [Aromatoleum aromaticum]